MEKKPKKLNLNCVDKSMNIHLSIVIPAYNEEYCIAAVINEVRESLQNVPHEILVIDDGSSDATASNAEQAGAKVIQHRRNRGYGASLKTGIRHAQNEWVLILDSDGQHRGGDIQLLLDALPEGYDTVIGMRDAQSFQYAARMPGKKFLHWLAGFLVGENPPDVNSGLRIFRKQDALTYFPLLPNGFSFTTTLTLAMLKDGYELGWVPIHVESRKGRRSNVSLRHGFNTIMLIVRIATLFNPLKIFLPVSVLLFVLGMIYGLWHLLFLAFNIPDGAVLLMIAGIIVFFFGVLADQMASIRRGG
jgi:glycosyltransferase involved in cell wall biosynthesis